jgi:hypothetical protein
VVSLLEKEEISELQLVEEPTTCQANDIEFIPCIDLARLRCRGKLRPGAWCLITIGKEKPDRILVFTKADGTGLTFIKRRPDGALGKLFVSFTYTPTAFNGWRAWFCCPGCKRRCRCLYGANTLRCRKCLRLLVAKAPSMDGAETRALAAVCGASVEGLPEGSGRAPAFAAHLVDVIARYQLDAFFTRDPSRSINGIDVRPGGVDRRTDAVDPKAMTEWRRAFKALPAVRQMMVADDHLPLPRRSRQAVAGALAQQLACGRCGRRTQRCRCAARLGSAGGALPGMVSRPDRRGG